MNKTFIYKKVNETEINAELFPTDQENNAPLILYIHGGGLIWGTRHDINEEQVKLFNKQGYHVLSIAYRLAPETKLPEIITDIQDALVWVKEELPGQLNYDQEKVIVIGNSAGGYLALMTGTFAVKPHAIVSFYGYGNILGDWYSTPSEYFNKMPQVNKALAKQLIRPNQIAEAPITARYAIYLFCRQKGVWLDYVTDPSNTTREDLLSYCPAVLVDEDYPPTLLLHGDADEDVPYEESLHMYEILKKHQIKSKLITIPNGKHQFDEEMDRDIVKDAFEQLFEFLDTI